MICVYVWVYLRNNVATKLHTHVFAKAKCALQVS